MLSNLDIDVILQILSWLRARDILALRKTSKQLYDITHLRTVWHNALTNLLANNVPLARIPGLPNISNDDSGSSNSQYFRIHDFSALSTAQLEALVLTTCRAVSAWECNRPKRTRAIQMKSRRVLRVFSLFFLRIRSSENPGDGEDPQFEKARYLLSFGHTATPALCVQVWDVDNTDRVGEDGQPHPVAEWNVNGRIIGYAVDEGNGMYAFGRACRAQRVVKGSMIAVSSRDFDQPGAVVFAFRILYFTPYGGGAENKELLTPCKAFLLRGPLNARAMRGGLVAVQVRAEDGETQKFGHGVLKVVDWLRSTDIYAQAPEDAYSLESGISDTGKEFAVKLEPSIHGANRAVLRVHFIHDWVIVFRESVMEMYFLPPWSITNEPRRIYPDAVHKWNWQINTCAVTERVSWEHDRMAMHCKTCNREGFVTVRVSTEKGEQERKVVCACRYRPLSFVARFDSYYPWPVNLLHHFVIHVNTDRDVTNLEVPVAPYLLPPKITHTVPSTVRLFSHSVLVLGTYGTLLWTDSEANSVEKEGATGTDAYFAEGVGERVAGRRLRLPRPPEIDPAHESASRTTKQQGTDPNNPEILPNSAPGQSTLTSVFATRLSEGWYSVALCESRGRVAIGDGEGTIGVWDHF